MINFFCFKVKYNYYEQGWRFLLIITHSHFAPFTNSHNNGEKMLNLLFFGCGTGDNQLLLQAAENLHEESCFIAVTSYLSEELDRKEETFTQALGNIPSADLIIINLHGSVQHFREIQRFLEIIESKKIPVFLMSTIEEEMDEYRRLFSFSDADYHQVYSYLHLGGLQNMRSLLLWVYVRIGGGDLSIPKPVKPPTHGIYHPGWYPGIQIAEFRMFLPKKSLKAGILFSQSLYLCKSLTVVDMLISSLENEDFDTIPVYCTFAPDSIRGSPGIVDIIRHYFMDENTPAIDVLIIMIELSQVGFSAPESELNGMQQDNLFSELGVPVLQVITTKKGYMEWEVNISGLSSLEISSHDVWQDYNEQIITVPVASHEQEENSRKNRGLEEYAEKIAKMAKAGAILRNTPVHERQSAKFLKT